MERIYLGNKYLGNDSYSKEEVDGLVIHSSEVAPPLNYAITTIQPTITPMIYTEGNKLAYSTHAAYGFYNAYDGFHTNTSYQDTNTYISLRYASDAAFTSQDPADMYNVLGALFIEWDWQNNFMQCPTFGRTSSSGGPNGYCFGYLDENGVFQPILRVDNDNIVIATETWTYVDQNTFKATGRSISGSKKDNQSRSLGRNYNMFVQMIDMGSDGIKINKTATYTSYSNPYVGAWQYTIIDPTLVDQLRKITTMVIIPFANNYDTFGISTSPYHIDRTAEGCGQVEFVQNYDMYNDDIDMLSDSIGTYNTVIDTLTSKGLTLKIDNNTLKVNNNGQLYANPLVRNVTALSGTSITLTDNSFNTLNVTGNTTFTLPTVTDTSITHTILVQLEMDTVYTISLGTTKYFNKTAPDLTSAGYYNLKYEYDNNMASWVVEAISKG